MKIKQLSIVFFTLFSALLFAQDKISFGIKGGAIFSSATLPDIEINTSISSVLNGDDVAKGVAQYADITVNYQLGVFLKHTSNIGFSMLETNYTKTKIYKEIHFDAGILGDIKTSVLDRDFTYLDITLSYNIFLSKNKNIFFTLGGGPAFLLSNSGSETPEKMDIRLFTGIGLYLSKNVFVSARGELGIKEVYKDSYIHHIMIPVGIAVSF